MVGPLIKIYIHTRKLLYQQNKRTGKWERLPVYNEAGSSALDLICKPNYISVNAPVAIDISQDEIILWIEIFF